MSSTALQKAHKIEAALVARVVAWMTVYGLMICILLPEDEGCLNWHTPQHMMPWNAISRNRNYQNEVGENPMTGFIMKQYSS